ncbi:MAG TPA: response regulator [Candidatus Baltobacteraceae bacterium]|nr:response regulator [Candidatus Baltobacteraceae bacterium]
MRSRPALLIVDRNSRNVELLSAFLEDSGYRTAGVSALETFDAYLDQLKAGEPDLALVDLTGFDTSIWDRCKRLHEASVAFVVIARAQAAEHARDTHRQSGGSGARHLLTKPLRKEHLLTLVRILTGTDNQPAP